MRVDCPGNVTAYVTSSSNYRFHFITTTETCVTSFLCDNLHDKDVVSTSEWIFVDGDWVQVDIRVFAERLVGRWTVVIPNRQIWSNQDEILLDIKLVIGLSDTEKPCIDVTKKNSKFK